MIEHSLLLRAEAHIFTASYGFLQDGAPENRHLPVTEPLEKTDMPRTGSDQFAETLAAAAVKRHYGIVGDSLNGLTHAVRRQGKIECVHVRHGAEPVRRALE
jgi:hypothetical protein